VISGVLFFGKAAGLAGYHFQSAGMQVNLSRTIWAKYCRS